MKRAWAVAILLGACAPAPTPAPGAGAPSRSAETCHQAYLTAGSDGPKLLAVDSMIVDSVATPPVRCGQLRSAHPAIKSSE